MLGFEVTHDDQVGGAKSGCRSNVPTGKARMSEPQGSADRNSDRALTADRTVSE